MSPTPKFASTLPGCSVGEVGRGAAERSFGIQRFALGHRGGRGGVWGLDEFGGYKVPFRSAKCGATKKRTMTMIIL